MAHQLAQLNHTKSAAHLKISGAWVVENVSHLRKALSLSKVDAKATKNITKFSIDAGTLEELDTSGAWVLVRYIRDLQQRGVEISFGGLKDNHQKILDIISKIEHPKNPKIKRPFIVVSWFILLGKATAGMVSTFAELLTFFGMFWATIARVIRHPSKLRIRSIVAHIFEICIKATPIVALMAFLISMVLGYQGANQLQQFGATIFTIDLVAISVLREMGVLITAIMVAGRSGSAFAAQIGVMQVNEEVDAMRTIGLDPFELLVLPRMLAILVALPVLTFIADVVGMFGTWFIAMTLLDISTLQFLDRLQSAVDINTFWVGLVKAPVFALLIGMVGCLQGLKVERSAAEVGSHTTIAVVQSIFLVILADAVFSVLFTMIGI